MSDEWMSLVLSSLLVHSDHFVPMQEIVFFSKKILNALRLVGVHNDMHFRHSACVYADIMMHE